MWDLKLYDDIWSSALFQIHADILICIDVFDSPDDSSSNFTTHENIFRTWIEVTLWYIRAGWPKKVFLFDKISNHGVLFNCLGIFRLWIFINRVRIEHHSNSVPLKTLRDILKYIYLCIWEAGFRQFWMIISANAQVVPDGHLWVTASQSYLIFW